MKNNDKRHIYRPERYLNQGGQIPNHDAAIQPILTDGDVAHYGNHLFEGYWRDALQKTQSIDQSRKYVNNQILNRYEYGTLMMGLYLECSIGSFTSNSGYQTIGGWTTRHNYLNDAGVDATGAFATEMYGTYEYTISGWIYDSTGDLTDGGAIVQVGGVNKSIGGTRIAPNGSKLTFLPVSYHALVSAGSSVIVAPLFLAQRAAGAATVEVRELSYHVRLLWYNK